MTRITPLFLLSILAICWVPQMSWANLLIHPTRVNFQSNERSQVLTLANTSNETATYQLQWKENVAIPEGGYRDMEESEKSSFQLASLLVR
jgi:P pilus assembly chaperone PapD